MGIAYLFCVIGITVIIFIINCNWIGDVNCSLNKLKSARGTIELKGILRYLIPHHGGRPDYFVVGYKIYKHTVLFGLINDILLLLVPIIAIVLYLLTEFPIVYLAIIPVANLIVTIISGIIVKKNCKPDSDPFH